MFYAANLHRVPLSYMHHTCRSDEPRLQSRTDINVSVFMFCIVLHPCDIAIQESRCTTTLDIINLTECQNYVNAPVASSMLIGHITERISEREKKKVEFVNKHDEQLSALKTPAECLRKPKFQNLSS